MFNRQSSRIRSCRSLCTELESVFGDVVPLIKPGISTSELDLFVGELLKERGLTSLFNINPTNAFPANITASVNDQIINGIPSEQKLKDGDLVSLQIGVARDGAFAYQAWTFPVGEISETDSKLIKTSMEALRAGLANVTAGKKVWEISSAIQETLERDGFTPNREYVGHGIGKLLHEEPSIPCYARERDRDRSPLLEKNQLLSIHVISHVGGHRSKIMPDEWATVSRDGKKSVHFSQIVVVGRGGHESLTNLLLAEHGGG